MIRRFCTSSARERARHCAVAQAPQPPPAAADSSAVTAIVDRARAAAGGEWGEAVEFFCGTSGRPNRADDPEIQPTRVFDNLYALGRTSTVVWALTTPDGILLIDAGYPDQLESVLLPQLRAARARPERRALRARRARPRRSFGGASYFQQRGARVALSAADWDLIENPPPGPCRCARGCAAAAGLPPPRRDVVVADGEPIRFGGVEITPVLIPGHTPGALGFVFRVRTVRAATQRRCSADRSCSSVGFPTTACANTCNRSSASAPSRSGSASTSRSKITRSTTGSRRSSNGSPRGAPATRIRSSSAPTHTSDS